MATLLKAEELKEGDFFCRWLRSRLITQNKNVLGCELGSTGSGKSYRDLRKAELWYKFYFNKPFPTENICFGVLSAMEKISSGKLRRGEVIIFEEAGANLGSLDFQNRISKMFSYVLQSFRSMNIAIFFNLPYFSMLNKQARMLMHYTFESNGIDSKTGINYCRPFFHQVNQKTGKIYTKFPKMRFKGKKKQIKRFGFAMPSQYLIDAYEKKKADYLKESTEDYTAKIKEIKIKELPKGKVVPEHLRLPLPEHLVRTYKYNQEGMTQTKIAELEGINQSCVSDRLVEIEKKGYPVNRMGGAKKPPIIPILTKP